jgi:hypothetical protein
VLISFLIRITQNSNLTADLRDDTQAFLDYATSTLLLATSTVHVTERTINPAVPHPSELHADSRMKPDTNSIYSNISPSPLHPLLIRPQTSRTIEIIL